MSLLRCPGQDQQNWKPNDIFIVICPICRNEIEFWKDEPVLTCFQCKTPIKNPKLDIGCTQWCQFAELCSIKSADFKM